MQTEEIIKNFFEELKKMKSDEFMSLVENHLNDDLIELCAENLEELYGIEDDEELGSLTQVFISGILLGNKLPEKNNHH